VHFVILLHWKTGLLINAQVLGWLSLQWRKNYPALDKKRGYWPVQINDNKFATGRILEKPVEVVKGRILAGWAQKSPEPWTSSEVSSQSIFIYAAVYLLKLLLELKLILVHVGSNLQFRSQSKPMTGLDTCFCRWWGYLKSITPWHRVIIRDVGNPSYGQESSQTRVFLI